MLVLLSVLTKQELTMAQPVEQCYFVGRSDEGYTCMSKERLDELLDMMPTLRFLLLGHPNMQPKVVKQTEDGTQILEIPSSLPVRMKSFLLLVSCAFKVKPLPKLGCEQLEELEETILILGGCKELEDRLQDIQDRVINPMTPEEDTEDEFEWAVLNRRLATNDDLHEMATSEFFFTKEIHDGSHGIENLLCFRKRRDYR